VKKTLSCFLLAGVACADKPNFVFILVDDMGWVGTSSEMIQGDDESKSDFYQTPNIDQLAKQGMRFSNAYSPSSLCTPSRAAILTGKTPAELHMTTPGRGRVQPWNKLAAPPPVTELPTSETTIAEALKKEGYATAHLGKWHMGRVSPGQHGFDVHDGATANGSEEGDADNPKDIFGITDRAVQFMTQHRDGPFYLQLSHYAVHSPFQCLEKSEEKFSRVRKGDRHSDVTMAAMTWDLDTSIGTLLAEIDKLGLADNTYVVLMSDNGGMSTPRESQNLPLSGGKGNLYEGGIRVPLIICGPGIKAGTFCSENVTGCDLFPTFCELAGFPNIGKIEGVSLVPLLTGQGIFQRSEDSLLFHFPNYGPGPNQGPQSAIIVGSWKLIRNYETGTVQLFDLKTDLSEQHDLSRKNPEKTQELEKRLDRRLKAVDAQMPYANPDYDSSVSQPRRAHR
jgi:arylsulfatase A-like enzyme